ncbi:hypothetical protein PSECIP111951_02232 [Pseudoalteromonas holothuriae]|uniref:Uncharacterized protein n=1 Tax=Pseudoalteromonas holothuriae TaxID=2963714 RepID=A0ABN8ULT0_9GAMM|nr:hypothetical protein [Pseudoalteromonas sp. CIP111951]CAH9060199.1 hypothetical protein PSECIP111951_02232 [Pseudoalteromonas sp. CIP111951]
MSHITFKTPTFLGGETLHEYRDRQMCEPRWANVVQGVSNQDLNNNFEFLNNAVLNRSADKELLLTTTGLFGPIRSGTLVHLDNQASNFVVQNKRGPMNPEADLITRLNRLHNERTGLPPSKECALCVSGFWSAVTDGAGINGLDGSANVFGSTGQLICDVDELSFPLLTYGSTPKSQQTYLDTLAYFGGILLAPKEEFALGFNQDLWGIQYDQKLPQYITDYQFSATKAGGLFVEHHPFPHIWLPAQGKDRVFGNHTVSRILLGRRLDSTHEDDYYRTVTTQQYHFSMFEIPLDGSALAIRPQCIHNDSFTEGAQTVFLANTPANTVALRHSTPIKKMSAGGVSVWDLQK